MGLGDDDFDKMLAEFEDFVENPADKADAKKKRRRADEPARPDDERRRRDEARRPEEERRTGGREDEKRRSEERRRQEEERKQQEEARLRREADLKRKEEEEAKRQAEFEERLKRLPSPDRERVMRRRQKFERNRPVVGQPKTIRLRGPSVEPAPPAAQRRSESPPPADADALELSVDEELLSLRRPQSVRCRLADDLVCNGSSGGRPASSVFSRLGGGKSASGAAAVAKSTDSGVSRRKLRLKRHSRDGGTAGGGGELPSELPISY
ncbi:vicilin-like seed storage protein At2g18540 [Pollicipes pollicipes]|uniref:vicilin-like seed storage protein At2g18540 n=1 Tax=Pollicipes pollicipes TaxID=41117 RepID=UPI0018850805|nr:vicilin-like seed storage protein At2g18540 [Pollicipes pollicipes]